MAPRKRSPVVDNDDGGDEPLEHLFYDGDDETGDGGFESDVDGDVDSDIDGEFECGLDSDSDSDDDSEAGEPDSYIDIGIDVDYPPKDDLDREPETDTHGDVAVNDASDGGNRGTEANKSHGANHPKSRAFDIQAAFDRMSSIDMDDDEAVERMIADLMDPADRQAMEMTQEKMEGIISKLPNNAEGIRVLDNDPEAKRCAEKHRERLGTLIKRQAKLMLAIGDVRNIPSGMRPWAMITVANASTESRERLLKVLTHPAIHPLPYQYRLGKDQWSPEMFKKAPKINLKAPDQAGDCATTYLGIGRHEDGTYYMYIGSASGTKPTAGAIGEGSRMRVHDTILNAGAAAILRERRSTVRTKGAPALLVHELFSQCAEYSFMALFRLPIDIEDPLYPMCAALALVAENLMTLLLDSLTISRVPRNSRNVAYQVMSQALMAALRPEEGFPKGTWDGANVVLPMVQTAPAIWALRRKHRRLVLTPELKAKLEARFDETKDPTLPEKERRRLLALEGVSDTPTNSKALQDLYATVLWEHGEQFLTYQLLRTKKNCILFSAMIEEAEHEKLANGPHGNSYHLEASLLNWDHVSQKAQDRAEEGLRKYFATGADCRKLYNGGKNDFFKNAMYKTNWETLRKGVPKTLAKAEREPRYPAPVSERLREICQKIVYQHMARQRLIEETPTSVQLPNQPVRNQGLFVGPVIEQLKHDVGISTSLEVADGVWEGQTLKGRVGRLISRVIKDLKAGLTRSDADLWANLKEVDSKWAEPQTAATDMDILLPELPQQPRRQATQTLAPGDDDSQDEIFQVLLEKHVSPDRIIKVTQRASLYGLRKNGEVVPTAGDIPHFGQDPFSLCGPDGQPPAGSAFTAESAEPQSRKGLAVNFAAISN
ncbi:hypothetical protein N0V84_001640 [Fusarium piperis]|uniref:Uncharacterized protein n=1 Tax=Fusarium piperis TaxID=1435070 RepID=A0A9W9BU55_9HYPO|nr:hypothetical protein N0V84_001640 [Fusarium piperis]